MTDFYCCDKMKEEVDLEEFTVKEMIQILDIEFCPWCGYKLKMLE